MVNMQDHLGNMIEGVLIWNHCGAKKNGGGQWIVRTGSNSVRDWSE
jgi:hypothetical protein